MLARDEAGREILDKPQMGIFFEEHCVVKMPSEGQSALPTCSCEIYRVNGECAHALAILQVELGQAILASHPLPRASGAITPQVGPGRPPKSDAGPALQSAAASAQASQSRREGASGARALRRAQSDPGASVAGRACGVVVSQCARGTVASVDEISLERARARELLRHLRSVAEASGVRSLSSSAWLDGAPLVTGAASYGELIAGLRASLRRLQHDGFIVIHWNPRCRGDLHKCTIT